MTPLDAWNTVAACVAIVAGVALAGAGPATASPARTGAGRIASGSMVADPLLIELCPAERIAALTPRIIENPRYARRARSFATLSNPSAIEEVLAFAPDILVVSHFANPQTLTRLRERGVQVLDLGPMHGVETLRANVATLAALCGASAHGEMVTERFDERLRALGARIPPAERPRGLYLAIYATKIFGGARRTSYHDVLGAAGIVDAAADRYDGWPELSAEQILALAPELIVTKRGMAPVLCSRPGLELSRPCREGRIVEIDASLIDDPGLAIAEAAETLYEKVHGGTRR